MYYQLNFILIMIKKNHYNIKLQCSVIINKENKEQIYGSSMRHYTSTIIIKFIDKLRIFVNLCKVVKIYKIFTIQRKPLIWTLMFHIDIRRQILNKKKKINFEYLFIGKGEKVLVCVSNIQERNSMSRPTQTPNLFKCQLYMYALSLTLFH